MDQIDATSPRLSALRKFDFMELFHDNLSVAIYFVNKHSDGEKSHEVENIAWETRAQIPGELIEFLRQVGAESGDKYGLPRPKHSSEHQHRQQIEKTQWQVIKHSPVDDRNERNECA